MATNRGGAKRPNKKKGRQSASWRQARTFNHLMTGEVNDASGKWTSPDYLSVKAGMKEYIAKQAERCMRNKARNLSARRRKKNKGMHTPKKHAA